MKTIVTMNTQFRKSYLRNVVCFIRVVWPKLFFTYSVIVRFEFFSNLTKMQVEIPLKIFAFDELLPFTNRFYASFWFDILAHKPFICKVSILNGPKVCEIPITVTRIFANGVYFTTTTWNMFLQITFQSKASITSITLEGLLFFMKWSNMDV